MSNVIKSETNPVHRWIEPRLQKTMNRICDLTRSFHRNDQRSDLVRSALTSCLLALICLRSTHRIYMISGLCTAGAKVFLRPKSLHDLSAMDNWHLEQTVARIAGLAVIHLILKPQISHGLTAYALGCAIHFSLRGFFGNDYVLKALQKRRID